MESGTPTQRMHAGMLRLQCVIESMAIRLRDAQRGAVMAEYGLLLMVAMLAAFAIVVLFGSAVLGLFQDAYDQFTSSWGGGTPAPASP